ncbi:MAG: hypothetical protein Q7R32_05360 [Dehalococcoidia bacterium]|nr:hypothetical protein [Dehalococcoidia bacterium]
MDKGQRSQLLEKFERVTELPLLVGGKDGRTVTTADLMEKLEALESEIRLLRESRTT